MQVTRLYAILLVSFLVLAAADPLEAQTITHVPLYTFHGDFQFDEFGYSVSGAGDVNGDEIPDLIVGATRADNNGTNSGSARVLSGSDGSVLYNFDGDSQNDQFGLSVSGAGDVNGDGLADLIVGSFDDINNSFSGNARVLSGSDGSVLYNFNGDNTFDGFGRSVSGAGDVNGDGMADLIVGARHGSGNGSGSARVLSGSNGSVLYTFNGNRPEDQFGASVSGAGDINGDGMADLIIGANFEDSNGTNSGSARVLSGSDGSVLYNFYGDSTDDWFGHSVSGAGDVNGDGTSDLIVGARHGSSSGSGSARVLSGSDGSVLYDFDGDNADDRFGNSVSGAGDVNGDGMADLIVGAIRADNNGINSGSARVLSGDDGSVLYNFDGDGANDQFGISVSGAGDLNGDGFDDFIVGAQRGGSNDGGYARVFVSKIILRGDCNSDGVVNFFDIGPFIAILSESDYLAEADANEDGVVSFLDIQHFIALLSS